MSDPVRGVPRPRGRAPGAGGPPPPHPSPAVRRAGRSGRSSTHSARRHGTPRRAATSSWPACPTPWSSKRCATMRVRHRTQAGWAGCATRASRRCWPPSTTIPRVRGPCRIWRPSLGSRARRSRRGSRPRSGSRPCGTSPRSACSVRGRCCVTKGSRSPRAASLLGYGSEVSFAAAFKRAIGQSPGRYRRAAGSATLRRSSRPARARGRTERDEPGDLRRLGADLRDRRGLVERAPARRADGVQARDDAALLVEQLTLRGAGEPERSGSGQSRPRSRIASSSGSPQRVTSVRGPVQLTRASAATRGPGAGESDHATVAPVGDRVDQVGPDLEPAGGDIGVQPIGHLGRHPVPAYLPVPRVLDEEPTTLVQREPSPDVLGRCPEPVHDRAPADPLLPGRRNLVAEEGGEPVGRERAGRDLRDPGRRLLLDVPARAAARCG